MHAEVHLYDQTTSHLVGEFNQATYLLQPVCSVLRGDHWSAYNVSHYAAETRKYSTLVIIASCYAVQFNSLWIYAMRV